MARTRNIKPSFFVNAELGELSPLARLLFSGLWCHADREGRVQDRPKQIKAVILPYDDCDTNGLLNDLAAAGFITRYEARGIKVIEITNFIEHQTPHPKETASSLPAMEIPGNSTASSGKAGNRKRRKEKDLDQGSGSDLDQGSDQGELAAENSLPKHCPPPPPSLDTELGRAALTEWADYKRARRESYKSPHGWKSILEAFQDLGDHQLAAAVKASMASNYAGLFPDKSRQVTKKLEQDLEIPDFDSMEAA